ncbi:Histone chaperone asf1 [Clonorchis sinensis]|uniref:Histone chaperone asf1 n=1 Tax=Clonorchis sinensis TaxID=79923 RepID=A0A8T1M222_CLOSI|nr:Histone chaperone asf1 [Clonorchis sinensis]
MAKVNICNVEVLGNPSSFFDPFRFQITFECHEPLEDDLEWKLVYVSSAYNASLDQTLDSILVGPVPVGRHQFLFEADPPDPKKIPTEDIVGVTVVLIQALYRNQEFIRVGYYVNNEYKKEELRLEPPSEPILDELERHIIASDPRVTRFPIDWGDGLLDGCPEPVQVEEEEPEQQRTLIEEQEEEEPAAEVSDAAGEDGHLPMEEPAEEPSENLPITNGEEHDSGAIADKISATVACQQNSNSGVTAGLPLHQVQSAAIPMNGI